MRENPKERCFKSCVFIFIGIMFFGLLSAQSRSLKVRHLTNREGLSHNRVNCILQDRLGFMWFGTEDGLDKFDGYNLYSYKYNHKDSVSLKGNIVNKLDEDDYGNMWVGTNGGLCKYNPTHNNFVSIEGLSSYQDIIDSSPIIDVLSDANNNLWISIVDSGVFRINLQTKEVFRYINNEKPGSISSNYVWVLFEDSNENIWLGSRNGLDKFNKESQDFIHFLDLKQTKNISVNDVRSIAEDNDRNLFVGIYGNGIAYLNIDVLNKDSINYINQSFEADNSLPNNYVQEILADKRGGIWIGLENYGMVYLNENLQEYSYYTSKRANTQGLNNNSFYSMFQDSSNDIWIGTYNGGLNIIHNTKQIFRHYTNIRGEKNSLSHNNVTKFFESKDGIIWIGTDGGGLNKFDLISGNFTVFNNKNSGLNVNEVLSICEDEFGDLWIGTWGGGMSRYDRKKNTFTTYTMKNTNLRSDNIVKIIRDRKNRLVFITHGGGIAYFDKESKKAIDIDQKIPQNLELTVLTEDGFGNLVFGGFSGLYIYNVSESTLETFNHAPDNENSLSNNYVYAVQTFNDSILWIGTAGGLNKYNRKNKKFKAYFNEDGLPNNIINGILKGNDEHLWISTNYGISKFNPAIESFTNYTSNDGLQGNQFSKYSAFKTKSGLLFFGGVNGFNVFNPDDFKTNTTIPPVVITDFKLFNKSVIPSKDNSPLEKSITETKEIFLSYKQSSFSFSFVSLNYVSSEKNEYKYKLEGFDKEWVEGNNYRTATYTNVNHGKYVFMVKGSNDDGVWNDTGASIKIHISPPWWETGWFISAMIGLAILILIIIVIYVRKLRGEVINRKKAEAQILKNLKRIKHINKKLENYSFTISHDLKEPIRSIRTFSEFIQEDFGDQFDDEARDYFQRIIRASTKMAQMIDDLLVLSRIGRVDTEHKKVEISKVLSEVKEILQQLIKETNSTIIMGELPAIVCQPVWISALFQNLITNSIKYRGTRDPKIEINYSSLPGYHEFSIKDNGKGIAEDQINKIFGLFRRAHQDRNSEGSGAGLAIATDVVEQHNGQIWVNWSEIDNGTEMKFTIKKEE